MAIDPTTPVTPIIPSLPAGTATDSVAVLQALARQALAGSTAQLSEIVGRPTQATPTAGAPVEQAGQASTQDAGHAADPARTKDAPPAQPAPAARPPSETRLVRAVRIAAAQAVPRQAGLAPLMANIQAAVDRPDVPAEVREAGRALLAATPTAAAIATPRGLRRAVEGSGVFLEARMARAVDVPTVESATRPVETTDMKAALLVFRGALSAWLARAAPQAALRQEPSGSPAAAAPSETAEDTLAPRNTIGSTPAASPGPKPTAGPVATPPHQGGVPAAPAGSTPPPTLESLAASDAPEAPPPPRGEGKAPSVASGPAPAPVEEEPFDARFGAFVAAPKLSATPPQPARAALPAIVQLGLAAEEVAPEDLPGDFPPEAKPLAPKGYGATLAEPARAKAPPPPYAGGPIAGQRPAEQELPAGLPTVDLVRRLLKGANGALARQDLMQIASLPEQHHHEPEAAETRPQAARLNLDLPFMTPQGVAVAQFEISRDGGGSAGGAAGPDERTYRARFSIDMEPLGPVHALVTLTGARARVSLWAERAETIARLRAGEEALGAALRQAELSPEVAVHSGAPPSQGGVSPLGHFVDQAS